MRAFPEEIKYSIISGFLGALASLIGKIGMQYEYSDLYQIIAKIVILISSVICNTLMLRYFCKSTLLIGSSKATMLTFGINFVISTLFAVIILSEKFPVMYYLGLFFMVTGLFIISTDEEPKNITIK